MGKCGYVYILTNKKHGILYTGVTNNLERRIYQHKLRLLVGFSTKYNTNKLVWYLPSATIIDAIALEKKIKNRCRSWKIQLIEKDNPEWKDLAEGWNDEYRFVD